MSRRLLGGGTEPDPRFSLANERTFLAWVRTALALLAGGIALDAFAVDTFPAALRPWLASGLLGMSLLLSLWALRRWLMVERALRHGAALPLPGVAPLLSLGSALVAALVIGFLWWPA